MPHSLIVKKPVDAAEVLRRLNLRNTQKRVMSLSTNRSVGVTPTVTGTETKTGATKFAPVLFHQFNLSYGLGSHHVFIYPAKTILIVLVPAHEIEFVTIVFT